jgi:hypothetical protein
MTRALWRPSGGGAVSYGRGTLVVRSRATVGCTERFFFSREKLDIDLPGGPASTPSGAACIPTFRQWRIWMSVYMYRCSHRSSVAPSFETDPAAAEERFGTKTSSQVRDLDLPLAIFRWYWLKFCSVSLGSGCEYGVWRTDKAPLWTRRRSKRLEIFIRIFTFRCETDHFFIPTLDVCPNTFDDFSNPIQFMPAGSLSPGRFVPRTGLNWICLVSH